MRIITTHFTPASYNVGQMASQNHIDQITERVERLLVRHEEMQRTVALLTQQVHDLTQQRNQLSNQNQAALQRLEALIQQLPTEAGDTE